VVIVLYNGRADPGGAACLLAAFDYGNNPHVWSPDEYLDSIDWALLTHAYGSAGDLPAMLRTLLSPDADARARAEYDLYGNIWHQGSRYEASAYVVPYLVAIAADPATPSREWIIRLLGDLAIGNETREVTSGFDIAGLRRQLVGLANGDSVAGQSDESRLRALTPLEEQRARRRPFDLARRLREVRHEVATYDAVKTHLTEILPLLSDPDPNVAAASAFTAGWFPESGTLIAPALIDVIDGPGPANVRAAALVALGLVGAGGADTAVMDRCLGEPAPVRAGAILCAVMGAGSNASEDVMSVLYRYAVDQEEVEVWPWLTPRNDWALWLLDRCHVALSKSARFSRVQRLLAEMDLSGFWINEFNEAFEKGFPDPAVRETAYADLAPAQRLLIDYVLAYPEMLSDRHLLSSRTLWRHRLPETIQQLRAYADGTG
jgi:hypothetical protein